MLDVFLGYAPLYFLRQDLSLNLELSDYLGWMASKPRL